MANNPQSKLEQLRGLYPNAKWDNEDLKKFVEWEKKILEQIRRSDWRKHPVTIELASKCAAVLRQIDQDLRTREDIDHKLYIQSKKPYTWFLRLFSQDPDSILESIEAEIDQYIETVEQVKATERVD